MRNLPKCQDWTRAAKARGDGLRVHYKNTHETAAAIKNMTVQRAKRYLKNVMRKKEIVPFRRHTGAIGRHAQCKGTGCSQGRWPKKSALFLLDLVRNAEVNARAKLIKTDKLYISHIALNRARQGRRRTYRAHGRINKFNSHPCHIELFVEERAKKIPKPKSKPQFKKNHKLSSLIDKKARRNGRIARRLFKI